MDVFCCKDNQKSWFWLCRYYITIINCLRKGGYLCHIKIKINMKTMDLELMTLEELASVKGGGYWVKTAKGWEWVETYRLDPESEEE